MAEVALTEEQLTSIEELKGLKGKKRKQALVELADQGLKGVMVLRHLMGDEDKALRKLAVEVVEELGDTPPDEAYELLSVALDDAESSVRNASLKLLESLPGKGSLTPKLTQMMSAKKAREVLVAYGELSVPALVHVLEGDDKKARKQAVDVLAALGPAAKDASSALIAALSDDESSVRKAVYPALTAVGVDVELCRHGIVEALKQADKQAAEVALTWGVDAIDVFESLLESDNYRVRKFGLEHMAMLTEHLEEDDDYDAIIKALKDDKASVREAALRLFAVLPFAVEDALESLDELYDHPDAAVVLLKYGTDAVDTYKDMIRSTSLKDRRAYLNITHKLDEACRAELKEKTLALVKKEYQPELIKLGIAALSHFGVEDEAFKDAVEHHQDNWSEDVSEAAGKALVKRGFESRPSVWKECRLGRSVIRHFHRLGATFDHEAVTKVEAAPTDFQKTLTPALMDLLYGLSFPKTRSFNTFDSYGVVHIESGETSTFTSTRRYAKEEEEITCVVFGETDYRYFGLSTSEESDDPVVYMADYEGADGSWMYSSLSYFLQHFERPASLDS